MRLWKFPNEMNQLKRKEIAIHENSVGLSSTTNPKPKGQPSISLPAQANLTQQKAEPLRCLALRTRGVQLLVDGMTTTTGMVHSHFL